MGFYEQRIFPWLNDRLNRDPELQKLRAEAMAPARGKVIEIGFGSGANLPHYPAAVESVTAVEPNPGMRDRAARHTARIPVDVIAGTAESIPLPDGSFDTAVSTLTLCTVDDPDKALAELRRLLRDDGQLIILEHGLAGDAKIAKWQNRLNGIQHVVACGCNLNRDIAPLVERAGFRFESVRSFYAPKTPKTHGWVTVGTARKWS
jgi:ubiquinone/menaquinone biosynthesis C-methylase UbiE